MDAPFPFFVVTAWKENVNLVGFAAEVDSQNQCNNGVFSANKTDLITLSCLNLYLLRTLLEVFRENEKLGVD